MAHVSWVHVLQEKPFSFINFDLDELWTINSNDLNVQLICLGHRQHSPFAHGWLAGGFWLHCYYYYYLFVRSAHNGITISERVWHSTHAPIHPQIQMRKNWDLNEINLHMTWFASIVLDCLVYEFLWWIFGAALRKVYHKRFLNWLIFIPEIVNITISSS